MITLKTRLNLGLGVILAAGFGVQWALRSEALPAIAENQMVGRLNQDIDDIVQSLRKDDSGFILIDREALAPFYRRLHSGHYYRIETDDQRIYSPSIGTNRLLPAILDQDQPKRWHTEGPEGQPLLMFTRIVEIEGTPVEVTVGEDLTTLNRHITEIGSLILMLNGAIIFLALVLQWIFVRNALNPFIFLRRELANIVANPDWLKKSASTELMKAQEIRHLVDLVQQRLDRSRNAIGNLAHALKAPLTLLVRLADDPALKSHPFIREGLLKNTETLSKIIDGELRRARMAGSGPVAQAVRLKEETESLVKVVRTMYGTREIDFQITATDRSVPIDRHDFLELLGNLIDNAAKWAASAVLIKVWMAGPVLHLSVEDDGIGCDEATMTRLMERGARLDEAKKGHGLGLSIVKALLEQHEGHLRFSRSPKLGGLWVEISIPLDF